MSAYGDISCDLCGARFFELDSHCCDDSAIREQVATLRTRAERAEAEAEWCRANWQKAAFAVPTAEGFDIYGWMAERNKEKERADNAQSTIAELEATVGRLREAIIPHIADLERTAAKIEVIDGFKKSADQFRLAASELSAALGE